MQKWKRGTIICLGINLLFLYGLFTDYYEFFIKKCRDAFPFGYCPWGGEAMGWAWRSPDIYLTNLVSSCATLLFFIPISLYCFHKKNYTASFMLALSPIIISLIDSLLGTLLYHYAKFQLFKNKTKHTVVFFCCPQSRVFFIEKKGLYFSFMLCLFVI